MKHYLGFDNGVSGTWGIIKQSVDGSQAIQMGKVPTFSQQDYTKKAQNITRIDTKKLKTLIETNFTPEELARTFVVIERPMVNPTMFKASISGVRSFEAVLITIELFGLPYQVVDSKQWQSVLLPEGNKDTKKASLDIGNKLFPQFASICPAHPDRDGLLMTEWARRIGL